MASLSGEALYLIYRALTYGVSPLLRIHLRWRKLRGREHQTRWRERLGCPSAARPAGRLIWFHAVSLGEGLAVIPVIKCCLERSPDLTVLMTTTTSSAFEVIKNRLPSNVIYQFAPLDMPSAMDAFLQYWRPNALILMESELWPNIIIGAAKKGIALILLNARMSAKSFQNWSHPLICPLITLMLSKFSLILPLLLQAPPFIVHYCGDLKCAIEKFDISEEGKKSMEDFQSQLLDRKTWMASSIHNGEDEVILSVHNSLKQFHPDILTIIVPRKPHLGQDIALKLRRSGVCVALRSQGEKITLDTNVFVVDSLGELRLFYRLTPIAVIGGSFLQGCTGHNILEAAEAGCAVLTGHHSGHFSHMVSEMQGVNPLSVLQVSGEMLADAVGELLSNAKVLESRRMAAKQAYRTLSNGIVENIWQMLDIHILRKSL
ncbi:probable 3-deoxy-D-manno-octulosonic acid transferase, mitochondrial isoform X2 [Andrographis paniculata]|uniref:probable 3-deoxy-D-manno-octulosonic acid transferase, mitochondrial isoform X2 n=1 Tax=Andrographis paniculata TaxID=175694 RepID=UPI0021E8C2CE|nr:probable 3-deoxy-D-manno-octulosonic acid transferase, mitochondrial isoform X2 [Andrographis paniculata]